MRRYTTLAEPARTKAKSHQELFAQMHRELRAHNPEIPESADRLDPVMRIMLNLYAGQLAEIDQRVDSLWTVAKNAVLRALYPESTRWPIPAYTVMKCDASDPVVTVDRHTKFYYREQRDGGQTFFFAPEKEERVINARVAHLFARSGAELFKKPVTKEQPGSAAVSANRIEYYLAIEFEGEPADLAGTALYLEGDSKLTNLLRWGHWAPSAASGQFYDDVSFCPGLTGTIDDIIGDPDAEAHRWGGLRSHADLFRQLEPHFVLFPQAFCASWQLAPISQEIAPLLAENPDATGERYYWIRVVLPSGGDRSVVGTALSAHFGCVVATNRNELTLFKHTGAARVVDIEIPESLDHLLGIRSVVDSSGREYLPSHRAHTRADVGTYGQEERNKRISLRFDFSSDLTAPPDSITVTYEVTAAIAANGVEVGQIDDLYERHPGVAAVTNLTVVTGAIPAKSEQAVVTEVSTRLRSRDRALSYTDISRWAETFDTRIAKVSCKPGVQRAERGVRRCVVVTVSLKKRDFHSTDEINLLKSRLGTFLKSRSPLNTWYSVETDLA